jgi:type I restriction enzyme S subunit
VFAETALKRIPANSVLIVVRGMILVHTVPVAIAKVDCAINQDMKALEPNSRLLPEFLFWTLRLLHETLLQSVSTAAHGTKKIDMAVIDNLTIPIPPLELQIDFKKKAEKLLHMQDRSRSLTDAALSTAASLSSAAFGLKAL